MPNSTGFSSPQVSTNYRKKIYGHPVIYRAKVIAVYFWLGRYIRERTVLGF